jgi:predicted nucleic acid-binding protein
MIAADTSSVIAYVQGDNQADAKAVAAAIDDGSLCLPPVVVCELLSDPKAGAALGPLVANMTQLAVTDGYWKRAALARRTVIALGFKARLGDALTAQSCIDHNVRLIARDKDFRHFAKHCGLILA